MKNIKYIVSLIFIGFIGTFSLSCSEDALDEINENPNNPTEVPLNLNLPVLQTNLAYSVVGGDLSLYASVWVQHTTGVHAQLHQADRFVYTNNLVNNTWNSIYATVLKNLKNLIDQATVEESFAYVGVGQIIKAYTIAFATDTWGRVPYTEANLGTQNRNPVFDSQESIYTDPQSGLLVLLDSAILNLERETVMAPGDDDLFYGGDLDLWKKAAYGLKAKFLTRLSNTSTYDAAAVLSAVSNSFADPSEALIFDQFTSGPTNENPWYQERFDRIHFAASQSLFELLSSEGDPRTIFFFDEGFETVPAPNGSAQLDQGGDLYTKMYSYVDADDPIELLTYDELLLIRAEALLRTDEIEEANIAYKEAVENAFIRQLAKAGADLSSVVDEDDDDSFTYGELYEQFETNTDVFPSDANLALEDIWIQKYIGFYPYQSVEAYAEYRRTDTPNLTNPNGDIPRRMPYPQGEIDSNGENVPNVQPTNGVWWDDGSED